MLYFVIIYHPDLNYEGNIYQRAKINIYYKMSGLQILLCLNYCSQIKQTINYPLNIVS